MALNIGWGELIVILLVALLVFGPDRLPEMARSVGQFVRNFQRETSKALDELKQATEPVAGVIDQPDPLADLREPATGPPAGAPDVPAGNGTPASEDI